MPGLPSCLMAAMVLLVTLATGSTVAAPAGAASGPGQQCAIASRRAELTLGLPSGLLQAIALTESGRWDGALHRSFAWPWTVTSGGDGAYLDSKAEALARIDALQRAGRGNIDVGCMQVNLRHHPDAFASLEQALDPTRNVAYGAAFLADLRAQTQSWDMAIERYHSSDPERGRAYRERVLENWRRIRPDLPAATSPMLEAASAVRPTSRPAAQRLQAAGSHGDPAGRRGREPGRRAGRLALAHACRILPHRRRREAATPRLRRPARGGPSRPLPGSRPRGLASARMIGAL